MINKKNSLVGKEVNTPDGKGVIIQVEEFNNTIRYGVRHYIYPPKRIVGMYLDDILYYFKKELKK